MSRIWQALKQAEAERAQAPPALRDSGVPRDAGVEEIDREPVSAAHGPDGATSSERRKGLRHSHETTLLVYGSDAEKQPFHEESETVDANENGCLITLASVVVRGQRLFLTNTRNQAEQECRVIYVGKRAHGKARVGVEFPNSTPQFWRRGLTP